MGKFDGKIYRLEFLFLIIILFIVNSLSAQNTDQVAYRLRAPFYEDDKALPTIILTAEEARPVGVRFELKGVTLRWIGDKINEIKGVVKTPSAIYDKSSLQVMGDKKIEYRSLAMDLDGVGFDIDQVKQIIHIRSKVKVVLRERLDEHEAKNKKFGKFSFKKSTKGLSLEKITKPESDRKDKLNSESKSGFDWASMLWILILVVAAFTLIKLLLNRKKKIDSGKKAGRKFF